MNIDNDDECDINFPPPSFSALTRNYYQPDLIKIVKMFINQVDMDDILAEMKLMRGDPISNTVF